MCKNEAEGLSIHVVAVEAAVHIWIWSFYKRHVGFSRFRYFNSTLPLSNSSGSLITFAQEKNAPSPSNQLAEYLLQQTHSRDIGLQADNFNTQRDRHT